MPAQTVVAEAAIDTLTGNTGFTVIVNVLDVAGLPAVQVALEVTTQETASLLAGLNEYEAFVAPVTFTALTFH